MIPVDPHHLRSRGANIARAGLMLDHIVTDLDETVWDWCYPVLRQPRGLWQHTEYLYLRRPLLWLFDGMRDASGGPLTAWTAGFGYRLDQAVKGSPLLGRLLQLDPEGDGPSEAAANVVTRLDFLTALKQAPEAMRDLEERKVSQKLPGYPSLAGKPLADDKRVLLDDKRHNCQRFADSAPGRAAIWLRGAARDWRNSLRLVRPWIPEPRAWADGVADALDRIAQGETGVFDVDPRPAEYNMTPTPVALPHRIVVRDWIAPAREAKRIFAGL